MKLLGAEEEDLAEGDGERAGQLGETEGRRIAAEEEIQDELLAGGEAGDERTAVARESGGNGVVRGFGVNGERLERRSCRDDGSHGRRLGERRDEVEAKLRRLAALMRREEIAHLPATASHTRRDLIAARDQLVHHQPDPDHRFLHRQFSVPFLSGHYPPTIYYYVGKWQVSARFTDGKEAELPKSPVNAGLNIFTFRLDREFQLPFTYPLT